jgi:general secretion pathway protein A
MYQQYFGLSDAPFSIAVNPRYLFMSARHRDALAHLLYGVGSGGGFILLTGEVGTGKTTLNRCLLEQLPQNTDIAIVLNPALSAVELLATVCDEFNIDYPRETESLKTLTDALHQFLLRNHQRERRTVLMIDEAQHLGFDVLEQIRLLTNLETDEKKLLHIILTGQPELATMLARPELRQLNQRITARFDLTPLNAQETQTYVRHRLQVAGLPDGPEIFSQGALREVYRLSSGVPRVINLLCDRAMMGAYGRDQSTISAGLVKEAGRETFGVHSSVLVGGAEGSNRGGRSTPIVLMSAIVLFVLGAVVMWGRQFYGVESVGSLAQQGTAVPLADAPQGQEAEAINPSPTISMSEAWILSADMAKQGLWSMVTARPLTGELCEQSPAEGYRCEQSDADVWDQLLANNRPAILTVRRRNGFAGSALIVGLEQETALLWTKAFLCEVPVGELALYWRGGFDYLWKSPPGWTGPLSEGDRGPAVARVVRDLSRLDNLPPPPLEVFTPALTERVRQFQQMAGLQVDGVIGVRTLQALNDELGESITLASAGAAVPRAAEVRQCL